MAFTFLDFLTVTSVCLNFKWFVSKGKGWYFFKEKVVNKNVTFAVLFCFFYFTYLVVLNSIKIKHFSLMTMSNK